MKSMFRVRYKEVEIKIEREMYTPCEKKREIM